MDFAQLILTALTCAYDRAHSDCFELCLRLIKQVLQILTDAGFLQRDTAYRITKYMFKQKAPPSRVLPLESTVSAPPINLCITVRNITLTSHCPIAH